jgi:hypothetical protein
LALRRGLDAVLEPTMPDVVVMMGLMVVKLVADEPFAEAS